MHNPHSQYCDHERMAETPLVPDAGTVPASQMVLDPIREQGEEGEREIDVRHPKRLKSEQKYNRDPERKSDRLSVKKALRHHTTVSGGGEPGGAGSAKDGNSRTLMPVSLSVSQGGGALHQQEPLRQPQLLVSMSRTEQQLPQPPI